MTKAELRKIYTEKREALSADEYALLNQKLLEQFKKLDLSAVKCIHIFLSILSRREPDTYPIIDYLQKCYPSIRIVFPKTNFSDNSMQSYANNEHLKLAENTYAIIEPLSGTLVPDHEIDMILLPLLAFDKKGYRVGYGKGFYDRFIEYCRTDVELIGLSFFEPVDKIIDLNGFDKKMHLCVTPHKIYTF